MKTLLAAIAACTLMTTAGLAADPAGPADKKDSGSLSSGAKESMPATKKQGENMPTGGSASTGSSAGTTGTDTVPGTDKGTGSSDPTGTEK